MAAFSTPRSWRNPILDGEKNISGHVASDLDRKQGHEVVD